MLSTNVIIYLEEERSKQEGSEYRVQCQNTYLNNEGEIMECNQLCELMFPAADIKAKSQK